MKKLVSTLGWVGAGGVIFTAVMMALPVLFPILDPFWWMR